MKNFCVIAATLLSLLLLVTCGSRLQSAQPANTPVVEAQRTEPCLDPLLVGALTTGGYPLLAYSADDLFFTEVLDEIPSDENYPVTMPIFRNYMADHHGVNEDAMRSCMVETLSALGLDTALEEEAIFEQGSGSEEEWQAILDAAQGDASHALEIECGYWGNLIYLQLQDHPALEQNGIERILVSNNLSVSIDFIKKEGSEFDPVTDREDAVSQAERLLGAYAPLLEKLHVNAPAPEGGDYNIYGEQYGPLCTFYQTSKVPSPDLAKMENLLNLNYRSVGVSSNTDGSLRTVYWSAAGPGEWLMEYSVLTEDEALDALEQGECYGFYDERLDCRQGAAEVLQSRLTYTGPDAAFHVPVWEFLVELGPEQNEEAAAMGLKDYAKLYVPAVDAITLRQLIEENTDFYKRASPAPSGKTD